jgi:hypothetical protein
METQLDHTYLRPGLIGRAVAVGLAAVGVGAGVLLASWGLSFFWRYDDPVLHRLDALTHQLETLAQGETGELKAVNYTLGQLAQKTVQQTGDLNRKLDQAIEAINLKIDTLNRKMVMAPGNSFGDGKTPNGDIIRREVTVFSSIDHYGGQVTTGWKYKDGASAGAPFNQYCYWLIRNSDGQSTKIDLANDGKRLYNIGPVPVVEEALAKCQWWNGS